MEVVEFIRMRVYLNEERDFELIFKMNNWNYIDVRINIVNKVGEEVVIFVKVIVDWEFGLNFGDIVVIFCCWGGLGDNKYIFV